MLDNEINNMSFWQCIYLRFFFLLCLFFRFNTFCKLLIIIIKIKRWLQKWHRTKRFREFGQHKSDYIKHNVSAEQLSSLADSATRGGVISKLQKL